MSKLQFFSRKDMATPRATLSELERICKDLWLGSKEQCGELLKVFIAGWHRARSNPKIGYF